jgi:hypothetical protein
MPIANKPEAKMASDAGSGTGGFWSTVLTRALIEAVPSGPPLTIMSLVIAISLTSKNGQPVPSEMWLELRMA